MQRLIPAAMLLLGATVVWPVAAQSGLAGSWVTEFDIGIRNENGVESSMGKRQATIVLAVAGDSVTGTWQAAAEAGAPAPAPIRLKGTRAGARVTLQTEPVEHTVRRNDDELRVRIVTTYSFELKGDTLEGTLKNAALDGSFESADRPFSAKRVRQ